MVVQLLVLHLLLSHLQAVLAGAEVLLVPCVGGAQLLLRLDSLQEGGAGRLRTFGADDVAHNRRGGVDIGREGRGRLGDGHGVSAEERGGGALWRRGLGGGGGRPGQRGEGDAADGLAAALPEPLTRQLGAQAVQGAGPDVARARGGVGGAGAGGAALRRVPPCRKTEKEKQKEKK